MKRARIKTVVAAALLTGLLLGSAEWPSGQHAANASTPAWLPDGTAAAGIHKIQHVVIIMQENRSFDSYFGTYPGAAGIPGLAGNPGTLPCLPTADGQSCLSSYHDVSVKNAGGPHLTASALADIAGGQMTGFVTQAQGAWSTFCATHPNNPLCTTEPTSPDVMGYHDAREIPNYWAYAQHFGLQDHMFTASKSWSLPTHLYLLSGWSAHCTIKANPTSCRSAPDYPGSPPHSPFNPTSNKPDYAWTDLTYLFHKYGVSWGYYIATGNQPDCADNAVLCGPVNQDAAVPGIWNPLPYFDTVRQDNQLQNIKQLHNFYTALATNTLPAVSWIVPNEKASEHPPRLVTNGQTYVTGLINAIMSSSAWGSTAIFLSWDDWGGFYDHLVPPTLDGQGYGIRVPGLVISPYARQGYIDHQILSPDAYLKFIEDDFLNGQRLDPQTDGRPDPRPNVRENATILGNLARDFNFNQTPLPPLLLPLHPPIG